MNQQEEIWATVSVNTLYEVSSLGNVRRIGGRVLKPSTINTGYQFVSLSMKGVVKHHTVHRLVCMAFCGQPSAKMTVNHKDGDKLNNRATNLEWVTYKENNMHALATGLRRHPDQRGERNARSKLTFDAAREIVENPLKLKGVELARKFGVSPQLISDVKRRKCWPTLFRKAREA